MGLLDELEQRSSLAAVERAHIRKACGVSQARLASELGVHRVTVARWEDGSRVPEGDLAARYYALIEDLRKYARRKGLTDLP